MASSGTVDGVSLFDVKGGVRLAEGAGSALPPQRAPPAAPEAVLQLGQMRFKMLPDLTRACAQLLLAVRGTRVLTDARLLPRVRSLARAGVGHRAGGVDHRGRRRQDHARARDQHGVLRACSHRLLRPRADLRRVQVDDVKAKFGLVMSPYADRCQAALAPYREGVR